MKRRRQLSLEVLSPLIADIHDAATSEGRWPAILRQIGSLTEAPSVTLWKETVAGEFRDIFTGDPECHITRDYANYFYKCDQLLPAIKRAPAHTILSGDMVVNRADFIHSEFYTDFTSKHRVADCIHARVFGNDRYSGYFAVSSSKYAGPDEFRLVSLLLPHLAHAMKLAQKLGDLGVKHDTALETLDLIRDSALIVDAQSRLLHANRAGETMLRNRDPLIAERGSLRLIAHSGQHTADLHRLVREAAAIGQHRIEGRAPFNGSIKLNTADLRSVLLRAVPLRGLTTWNPSPRAAALLLVTTLTNHLSASLLAQLQALFCLTPTEAAVAGHVGRGKGVNAVAVEMKVTPATLRWHLQRVFAKTGTARQSELARLVERLDSVGHSPSDADV